MKILRASLACFVVLLLVLPVVATAHKERPVRFPSGGSVPRYKTSGPSIVVCKKDSRRRIAKLPPKLRARNRALLRRCRTRSIQKAVDLVKRRGTRILVLPGRYEEQRSLKRPSERCADFYRAARDNDKTNDIMSYREQKACPHAQNLIAILGDGRDEDRACDRRLCKLQIEGTGRGPKDVVIDGRFKKLNVIRADRADGTYFRNFTVQQGHFNGLYVIEQDGFVIDRLLGRWNDEYGFLTFAVDHGLYKRCEAHGNGDGGLYPGGLPSFHGARYSVEIRRCRSHHNLLGFSGTGGDSVYVHHSRFWDNSVGIVMDSFAQDHPGVPQNSSVFKYNKVWGNNSNFYKYHDNGTCDKPSAKRGYRRGVVCPTFGVPVGTGILTAGGNHNLFVGNRVWNNWRRGMMLIWVPAAARGDKEPEKQYDTSHFNRYIGNIMSTAPGGKVKRNGVDFWWDEEGAGNCWEDNRSRAGEVTSDPQPLPDCEEVPMFSQGDTGKQAQHASCATWSPENNHPPGCDWMNTPDKPE